MEFLSPGKLGLNRPAEKMPSSLVYAQDVVNEIPALSQPEPVAASADVLGPDSLEISLAVHPQRRVDMYQVGLMSRDLPLQFRIIAGRCH